ncbi:cell wall metabolism sensor histidine kinase WalK [Demequina sp. NBRC 110054]|uniref:sensor histidine kinase n=1 Tax=Demequina sp. NBRC 110054 TaxID=1570343 RepID=UPI0027D7C233|nr:ATP-binding protein [Demequina sp. NBRC 110054]
MDWLRARGLATRMMLSFSLLIAVIGVTVWLVARLIGPADFSRRMMGGGRGDMMGRAGDTQAQELDEVFREASGTALAVALLIAAVLAVVLSLLLARRVARSLGKLQDAAHRVSDGDYASRVDAPGMGREFDELAESFNRMSARLEESEQLRQRMIGDVAHELRTPIATLTGYLEALEDGVAELTPETVAMLRAQGARLTRLSEDLSAASRAEGSAARLERERRDPVDLLRLAQAAARERAAEAGVALEVSAAEGLPAVDIDPERIAQVLGNLVDNALRHTPAGGTVTLGARRDDAGVALVVADTGVGIAPEHLPHVFERFYRADTARDRASGGSGVGLSIVAALVAAHGGSVRADSGGVGRGATFTVTLPATPV